MIRLIYLYQVLTNQITQGISTGRYHAAHLTNSDEMEQMTSLADRACGDLSFPIVYCPELQFIEFNSSVADMKNSVAVRRNYDF